MHAGLPTLHNGPAKQMQVSLTSALGMEEPTSAVPGLSFPRRQAWQKLPPLELNLSDVSRAGMSPALTIHIPDCVRLHCCILASGLILGFHA